MSTRHLDRAVSHLGDNSLNEFVRLTATGESLSLLKDVAAARPTKVDLLPSRTLGRGAGLRYFVNALARADE